MDATTWTATSAVITEWDVTTSPHRAGGIGGWGDAWGMFPWGSHGGYEDFTTISLETGTTWTKL
jgi:hypothetical protein